MKKRSIITLVLYLAILALLFSWVTGVFGNVTDDLAYSQVLELFREEQVKAFAVEGSQIHLLLHNPYNGKTQLLCSLADVNLFHQDMEEILATNRAKAIYEGFSKRIAAEELCRRCGYARRFT